METSSLLHDATAQIDRFIEQLSRIPENEIDQVPFPDLYAMNGSTTACDRAPGEKDTTLRDLFLNFERPLTSPESIEPKEAAHDKSLLLAKLDQLKAELTESVDRGGELSLLCTGFEVPQLGQLTRMEWVKFITYHVQRHVRQMERMATNHSSNLITSTVIP